MGYWYQPSYSSAPAPAHMQQGYIQGMQGYPYGGQFGYQQNYMGRVGVPGSWQAMGSQPNPSAAPASSQQMPPQAGGMASSNNMMSYAMGQFQTQWQILVD